MLSYVEHEETFITSGPDTIEDYIVRVIKSENIGEYIL